MAKKEFPSWIKTVYRGVRAGVSAGLVAAWAVKPDWTNFSQSSEVVAIAFGTAFMVSFGKFAREKLDEWFGYDEKSLVAKVFPV